MMTSGSVAEVPVRARVAEVVEVRVVVIPAAVEVRLVPDVAVVPVPAVPVVVVPVVVVPAVVVPVVAAGDVVVLDVVLDVVLEVVLDVVLGAVLGVVASTSHAVGLVNRI